MAQVMHQFNNATFLYHIILDAQWFCDLNVTFRLPEQCPVIGMLCNSELAKLCQIKKAFGCDGHKRCEKRQAETIFDVTVLFLKACAMFL